MTPQQLADDLEGLLISWGQPQSLTLKTHQVRDIIAVLRSSEADQRDAARYRHLKVLYDGVDFEYEGKPALIFDWPVGMKVSANLDDTLDAAMQQSGQSGKSAPEGKAG